MRYRTELMQAILTNKKAQDMIDYVSPIYGESYVGLWLFQAIGTILGEIYTIAEDLRYEANPVTATFLLDYWEDHYGLPRDSSLTIEQRRARLITKTRTRAPINPKRLAEAVSTVLGGVEVEVNENVAKNTFLVIIRDVVEDLKPAIAVIERLKPAHLIYQIKVATQMLSEVELKTAIAMTYSESFDLFVQAHTNAEIEQELKSSIAMAFGESFDMDVRSYTRTKLEQELRTAISVAIAEKFGKEVEQ